MWNSIFFELQGNYILKDEIKDIHANVSISSNGLIIEDARINVLELTDIRISNNKDYLIGGRCDITYPKEMQMQNALFSIVGDLTDPDQLNNILFNRLKTEGIILFVNCKLNENMSPLEIKKAYLKALEEEIRQIEKETYPLDWSKRINEE